jgi:hypothetical protein
MQTSNNSIKSTPPMPVAPINATNSSPEPIVATSDVTTGVTTSAAVDEIAATESQAPAFPTLDSSLPGGNSSGS